MREVLKEVLGCCVGAFGCCGEKFGLGREEEMSWGVTLLFFLEEFDLLGDSAWRKLEEGGK